MKSKIKSRAPHPLASIAWRALEEKECVDASSLAYYFAGACVRPGAASYRVVAKDVLGYMHDQGLLVIDEQGWHRRNPKLSFRQWLSILPRTDDPFGDFVDDVISDRGMPDDFESLDRLLMYLQIPPRRACPEAIEAATEVWERWERERA
jgi:hypothetical protein